MTMDFLIASAPTITEALFTEALAHRKSPALPEAGLLWRVCVDWEVNPACALAFFVHESSCGTQGIAVTTLNLGNLRDGPGAYKVASGFAHYACWTIGANDWCRLLRGPLYEGADLRTVSRVTPKYAPSADANDPVRYAAVVNFLIAEWQQLSGLKEA